MSSKDTWFPRPCSSDNFCGEAFNKDNNKFDYGNGDTKPMDPHLQKWSDDKDDFGKKSVIGSSIPSVVTSAAGASVVLSGISTVSKRTTLQMYHSSEMVEGNFVENAGLKAI